MPRTRRRIIANHPYELILRVREGLPFSTLEVIKLLLEGVIARAQRDNKVTICHYLWMGNHAHIILIPSNTELCVNFYQEVQKKITETFKRLLGKLRLNLWEGEPVLAQILDPDKMIQRIAYLYANPAKANLVESIADYPGLSSWVAFNTVGKKLEANVKQCVPWIQLPSIKRLPTRSLSRVQDAVKASMLKKTALLWHDLELKPNAWMNTFGFETDRDADQFFQRVKDSIYQMEQEAATLRIEKGQTVIGKKALREEAILKPHTPKKRERRIYVLTTLKELRIDFIRSMKEFCCECYRCYLLWKNGEQFVLWPPGAFRPMAPPLATAIY